MIVTPNRSQVLFHSQQSDLVSRLIEGTYPDIYSILPKKYTTRAVVETKEFAAALKSVVPFAQDNSYITQVKISQNAGNGTLIIEASTDEVGVNVSRIAAAIDGPDQELLFNIKYLANVLSVIDTAEVALEVTSKARPGQLLPVGDTNAQYVIMPMSVNR
jgi:DNA polymerase-3 subunit beta